MLSPMRFPPGPRRLFDLAANRGDSVDLADRIENDFYELLHRWAMRAGPRAKPYSQARRSFLFIRSWWWPAGRSPIRIMAVYAAAECERILRRICGAQLYR